LCNQIDHIDDVTDYFVKREKRKKMRGRGEKIRRGRGEGRKVVL
jgi:hypothetical protein